MYYRAFTREAAIELGIRGWVRNRPDGSVEALLQHADEAQLDGLVRRMREGPAAARVVELSVEPISDPEVYESFVIRH